jgi:hypothetical protein
MFQVLRRLVPNLSNYLALEGGGGMNPFKNSRSEECPNLGLSSGTTLRLIQLCKVHISLKLSLRLLQKLHQFTI